MTSPKSPQASGLFLVNLIGALIVGPMALLIFMPALPGIKNEFELTIQFAQLGLSLPLLAALLTPVIVGRLVDLIGRRPLLVLSYLLVAIGSLICIYATDYWLFLLGRVLVGAFSSANVVIARAVIQDVYKGPALQQAAVRFSIPPALALLVAPIVGGLLIDGFGWHSIFWFILGMTMFFLVLCWFTMPETIAEEKQDQSSRQITVLMRSKLLWGYIGQSSFQFAVAFSFASIAPYVVIEQLGHSTTEYSMALMSMIVSLLMGIMTIELFAKRWPIATVAFFASMFGLLMSAGFLFALLLNPVPLDGATIFLPCMLVAYCVGLGIPPTQAGIVSAVPSQAGTAAGLGTAVQMLAAIAFTHIAAIAWSDIQLTIAIMVSAAMTLAWLSASVSFTSQRRVNKPSKS